MSEAQPRRDDDAVSFRRMGKRTVDAQDEGYATFPRRKRARARRAGRSPTPTGYADASDVSLPDDGAPSPFFPRVLRSVSRRASTVFVSGQEAVLLGAKREAKEEGVRMWYSCVTLCCPNEES